MYSFVRSVWYSLHEPRIVTLMTMVMYAVLTTFGAYCLTHPYWGPAPFWQISAVGMLLFSPVALVASWRGMWQIERPMIFGVGGALVLNILCAMLDQAAGDFRFGYVVTLTLALQAFVARWVRIRRSYVSPARMVSEYRDVLGD